MRLYLFFILITKNKYYIMDKIDRTLLCIICQEPNNLIEYNHCGRMHIHPTCLLRWTSQKNNSCILCRKHITVEHCLDDYIFNMDIFVFKHHINQVCNNSNFIDYYLENVQDTSTINSSFEVRNIEQLYHWNLNTYSIKFIHRLDENNNITLYFYESKYFFVLSHEIKNYMYILFYYYYCCYYIQNSYNYIFDIKKIQIFIFGFVIYIGAMTEYLLYIFCIIMLYIFIQCQRGLTYVDDSTFY